MAQVSYFLRLTYDPNSPDVIGERLTMTVLHFQCSFADTTDIDKSVNVLSYNTMHGD